MQSLKINSVRPQAVRSVRKARSSVISFAKPVEGVGSVFRVDAADKVTVSAGSAFDAGCEVSRYIDLGGDLFATIQLPLGASIKKLGGARYELLVPQIKFFDHSFYPRIVVRMQVEGAGTATPALRLVSEVCEMVGPWVEQYNDRMDFNLDVTLAVNGQNLSSDAKIKVLGDPPMPLNLIPKEVLGTTGSMATQAVLTAFHRALAEVIVNDYKNWAKNDALRQTRAQTIAKIATINA